MVRAIYLIAYAASAVSLTACVSAQVDKPAPEAVALSQAEAQDVLNAVRASMKDPDSAQFSRQILSSRRGKTVTACGNVNGRNSFGGYVGQVPFVAVLEPGLKWDVAIASANEVGIGAIRQLCAEGGVGI